MPPEAALSRPRERATVPSAWRGPLLRLALAVAVLIGLAWSDWAEMMRQWWNFSTYNHILLVPPILVWLLRLRGPELMRLTPSAWWPGLVLLAAAMAAWLAGGLAGINLVVHFGTVAMLQAAVAALLGPRVAAALLFPLAYMLFLVPFGDEIVPALQATTAKLAIALTHASGVPATVEGVFIDTPAGLFEVAEACSGVKFLVAMVALGTLVAHMCFASWKRRAAFMTVAVTLPVLANGVRAWGTIYIAQSQGIEFAAGFDHIVYGWIFFALVMTAVLGASWRFFDRSPDDPLIDTDAIDASPRLARLARLDIPDRQAVVAVLILAAAGAWMDRMLAVP
jgi:exosortase A